MSATRATSIGALMATTLIALSQIGCSAEPSVTGTRVTFAPAEEGGPTYTQIPDTLASGPSNTPKPTARSMPTTSSAALSTPKPTAAQEPTYTPQITSVENVARTYLEAEKNEDCEVVKTLVAPEHRSLIDDTDDCLGLFSRRIKLVSYEISYIADFYDEYDLPPEFLYESAEEVGLDIQEGKMLHVVGRFEYIKYGVGSVTDAETFIMVEKVNGEWYLVLR